MDGHDVYAIRLNDGVLVYRTPSNAFYAQFHPHGVEARYASHLGRCLYRDTPRDGLEDIHENLYETDLF